MIQALHAAAACLTAAALLAGCGRPAERVPEPQAAEPPRDQPAPASPGLPPEPHGAPEVAVQEVPGKVVVRVRAVDAEGRPVEGVTPVATKSANMLEPAPVAEGAPTGPHGESEVLTPRGERVYVRTLHRDKKLFPNNVLEVTPEAGAYTARQEIVMVEKAQLLAKMLDADGFPIANADVALMLFHPSAGPWWPDEAWTGEDGVVRFEALPPGVYRVKLKTRAGGVLELPRVELPPGSLTNLGPLLPPEEADAPSGREA